MRSPILFLAIVLIALAGCHTGTPDKPVAAIDTTHAVQPSKYLIQGRDTFQREVDTFAIGDVNGDGKIDTAFLIGPYFANDSCKGTCMSIIHFSSGVADLKLGNNIGGAFYPQADVNDDGKGEILFIPSWFSSCWSGLYIYSYKGNSWVKLGEASIYSCADNPELDRVKKAGTGYIEITSDSMDLEGKMLKAAHKVKLP